MDMKAMAKSKRSHTQHHSKKAHPKSAGKVVLDGGKSTGDAKQVSGKKVVEKPFRAKGAELPSNRDRYLEEGDEEGEELLQGGTRSQMGTDVVMPKSKGADYRHLISEARIQSRSTDYLDVYSSFDEIMPDLYQALGDMLSARGESILSWTADDYFMVGDKASTGHEASFLSLNLNKLNEQLSKVDLSERLFIEPDILPPDLRPQKSEFHNYGNEEQREKGAENKESITALDFVNSPQPVKDKTVLKEVEIVSSSATDSGSQYDVSSSILMSLAKDDVWLLPSKRPPSLEASQAEAELDMLLDSLGETNIPTFSQKPSINPQVAGQIQTPKMVSGMGNTIDDLLADTSHSAMPSAKVMATTVLRPTNSSACSSKVKPVDDFDSWFDTL